MDLPRCYIPQQVQSSKTSPLCGRPPFQSGSSSFVPSLCPPSSQDQPQPSSPLSPFPSAEYKQLTLASPPSSLTSSRQIRQGTTSKPPVLQRSPTQQFAEIRPKAESDDSPRIIHQARSIERQEGEDEIPATCDFVRKLYRLLEDQSLSHILCWGPEGDFFIIKDVNTFTTNILPRTFKHSNFASFVRQLNKYDFHKIKSSDDNPFGENSWLFRHRDFRAGGLDALENIKRKVPGSRRDSQPMSPVLPANREALVDLQARIQRMAQQQGEMTMQIQNMETEYVSVLDEMINLQRSLQQQDGTMRELVQFALQQFQTDGAL
ncbi:hypothetical protein NM688_g111 [Phlebia brevispora]|uniref:Uncharacterized protein n=1 Tax=Phlebia brevispora TaxID=194682 RepID=A0ACC1TFJ3_9APHY|nr:hypothetical protein NM688_g111 [Phlebia brevispora]